jgi:polar amino acid transport system substrate-binding protein
MRVAAIEHSPWIIIDGHTTPRGAEAALVEAFARELGVSIAWRRAPAFEALAALGRGDVDLVVGGFTQEAVTAHKSAAHTFAYFTEALIIAAKPGAAIPQNLAGVQVSTPPTSLIHRLVEGEGAIAVSSDAEGAALVALPDWQVLERGLVPTGIVLQRRKHVIAVPPGENAWVMTIETFLRDKTPDMRARLRGYAQ